ncbi:MAG: transglycosylase domain-containing protein [Patescibacteria group bacterium]
MPSFALSKNNNIKFKEKGNGGFSFKRLLYALVLILACLFIGGSIMVVMKTRSDYNKIPSLRSSILEYYNKEGSVIVDKNDKILFDYRSSKNKKEQLESNQIPELAKYSILVREDENYYNTAGFSWKNFAGALLGCFRSRIIQDPNECRGGSGIFQQLIKNFDKPENRDLETKYNELLKSLKASEEISLDEALAMYINNMDFGRLSKGMEMGSKSFFGHSVNDPKFNPTKACFLAIMPNQPTGFTTAVKNRILGDGEEDERITFKWSYAKALIDDCLTKLSLVKIFPHKPTYLNPKEVEQWKNYNIIADIKKEIYDPNDQAKYYIRDYIEDELLTRFSDKFKDRKDLEDQLSNSNLTIKTTFDIDIQNQMEKSINNKIGVLSADNVNQVASAVVDNMTSELLAMQGNINYGDSQVNRLTGPYGYIMPGSSTKPYYFASVFDRGFNPATVLHDVKYIDPVIGNERSNDIIGKYQGYKTLRYGLQQSINTIAEQALYINQDGNDFAFKKGVKNSVQYAKNIGLKFQDGQDACMEKIDIAVGACQVQGLSHLNAFTTMANKGTYNEIRPLIEIKRNKETLIPIEEIKSKYQTNKQVMESAIANQIMNVLSDYDSRRDSGGSRSSDAINYELSGYDGDNSIAAKSGTSQINYEGKNQNGELTMIGGSKYISTLIWAGSVDIKNNKLPVKSGSNLITPIFKDMMSKFHEKLQPAGFSKEGLIEIKVDEQTGLFKEDGKKEYMTQKQIDLLKQAKADPKGTIFSNRVTVVREGSCLKALRIVDQFRFEEARDEIQKQFGGSSCVNNNNSTTNPNYKVDLNVVQSKKYKKNETISVVSNIEGKNATLSIQLQGPKQYTLKYYSNNASFSLDTFESGNYKVLVNVTDPKGSYNIREYSIFIE